ncbi:MAG: hypothetical protein L0Y71_25700 [Gemmataceae bacterium]|nr:hypothetical protein [Gemmataceae bacterium]
MHAGEGISNAGRTPHSLRSLDDFDQLSPQTTVDEFRAFLDRVGLSKNVKCYQRGDEMLDLIIPPPGARITFHDQKLWSVHFTDRTPPKRQISLSVSEDTWNRLKNLATKTKKSVSALCAEWITQRAGELERVPEEVGSPE